MVLAEGAPEQGLQQMLLMIGVAIMFGYFILWRPEAKRQRLLTEKRASLRKGDRVLVAGGILGEVHKIQPDSIILRLTDGAKMEVLKAAVQEVRPTAEPVERDGVTGEKEAE